MDGEEIAKVGTEAMRLMEDLAEDDTVPEGSTVDLVGLVVTLRYPAEDLADEVTATHTRVSTHNRMEQLGLFTSAVLVVADAPDVGEGG